MSLIIVYVFSGLIANAVFEPVLYDQRQSGETNVRIDIKDATFILMEGELGDYDYSYDYSDLTVKPEVMQTTAKPISLPPMPPYSTSSASSVSPASSESSASSATTTPTSTTTTESSESSSSPSSSASSSSSSTTTVNTTFVIEQENNTLTITPNKQDSNSSIPDKIQVLEPQQPLNSHNYQIPVVVIHEKQTETEKPTAGKPPEKTYVSSNDIRRKNSNGNVTALRTEDLPLRNCSPGFFLDSRNRCKKIRRPLEQRKRPQLPFGLRFAQRPEATAA